MDIFAILILLLSFKGNKQTRQVDFYGNKYSMLPLSANEKDSLVRQKGVPIKIKAYLLEIKYATSLDDWALMIFLRKFVESQFLIDSEAEKAKALNCILTGLGINNAIGIGPRRQVISLVSINNKIKLNKVPLFEKDGYKFIVLDPNNKLEKLRDLELNCHSEFLDIQLDYAKAPKLTNIESKSKVAVFYNFNSKQSDSIRFEYSEMYNRYYNDLPRIWPDHHYFRAPVSEVFNYSFFSALDQKMGQSNSRLDSINFLVKFVQTSVKFEEDIEIYGKEDFCSFPENTFALGLGDCEDKCEAFAFLINHYFSMIDIVFFNYPGHITIGLNDPKMPIRNEPYKEFEGKKYLEAELQDSSTVLGDKTFSIFHSAPTFIIR